MILVNFKIYKETFGEGAVKLAKVCQRIMEKTKIKIIPVVSPFDVYRISKEVGIEVLAQRVDECADGAKTGWISMTQAKEAGAIGAMINHSEYKIKPGTIKKMLKAWPRNFMSIVCIQTVGQAEGWAKNIRPTIIAYEPPELIGNKDRSVATEKADLIKSMVEKYPKVPVIAGAGIHERTDVEVCLKMGAKGVLVASDVVLAKDPERELLNLAEGFNGII